MHFASFVEWPNKELNSVHICIVGKDPFGAFFDKMIQSKPTNHAGKKISLSRMDVGERLDLCNIVYSTKKSTTEKFWQTIPQHHSILLVSDFDQFTHIGGLVVFYNEKKMFALKLILKLLKMRISKLALNY